MNLSVLLRSSFSDEFVNSPYIFRVTHMPFYVLPNSLRFFITHTNDITQNKYKNICCWEKTNRRQTKMNSIELPPQFPNACQKIGALPELGKHFNNSANTLRLPHNDSIIASNITRFAYKKKGRKSVANKKKRWKVFWHIIQRNRRQKMIGM